jgi:hypothetical protein
MWDYLLVQAGCIDTERILRRDPYLLGKRVLDAREVLIEDCLLVQAG